ncbi:hypothetical protein [Acidithiobacillus ferriphilus]|uniref:hypothetical protein n=1 Tax=Acidithiobacillus ferriphilus TaxID=1689834 RepID=UPI001E57CDC5|nr:hypothetical protein [Acidithiobacillus ferriphilus]
MNVRGQHPPQRIAEMDAFGTLHRQAGREDGIPCIGDTFSQGIMFVTTTTVSHV